MDEAEAFGNLPSITQLVIVLDEMACPIILVHYFIDLVNFFGMSILANRVLQSWLTDCKMVFHIIILIAVLALTRRALVHFGFVHPIEV